MSGGVDGRGGGGPPYGDREGGDDHSDGGARSPRKPTPESGPGAAMSTTGAVGSVDRLEERLDMAGFGLDFLSLGRLSRRGDALNSLDSADLNVLAGAAPVPPRPKFNAAEDCGGASVEGRTNGPSPGTVIDGDAELDAAGVAAIRAVHARGPLQATPLATLALRGKKRYVEHLTVPTEMPVAHLRHRVYAKYGQRSKRALYSGVR